MTEEIEWTTDMNISRPKGVSNKVIADWIMEGLMKGTHFETIFSSLINEFNLSEYDANLALDRTQGGIVRALTGNPSNKPNWKEDPLAFCSFEAVWNTLPKKSLFSKKRSPSGPWNDWYKRRHNA